MQPIGAELISDDVYRCAGTRPGLVGYLVRNDRGWTAVDADEAYLDEAAVSPVRTLFTCPLLRASVTDARLDSPTWPVSGAVSYGSDTGHQVVHSPTHRILFVGDLLDEPRPCRASPVCREPLPAELHVLAALLRLDAEIAFTASGRRLTDHPRQAAIRLEHIRSRCQQVLEAVAAGAETTEAIIGFLQSHAAFDWSDGVVPIHALVTSYLTVLVDEAHLVRASGVGRDIYRIAVSSY